MHTMSSKISIWRKNHHVVRYPQDLQPLTITRYHPVTTMPVLVIVFAEQLPTVECVRRQSAADYLLTTDDQELQARSPHSDAHIKVKHVYEKELVIVQRSGQCPLSLYMATLVLRSQMGMETHDVEGDNSVHQNMARVAPSMKWRLASDRMGFKLGDPLHPPVCVAHIRPPCSSRAILQF